jgi:hypothetical protein
MAAMGRGAPGRCPEENVGEDWTQNCQGALRAAEGAASRQRLFFGSEADGTPVRLQLKGDVVATMPVTDDDGPSARSTFRRSAVRGAREPPHSPHGSAVMSVHKDLTFSQFLPLLAEDGGAPPRKLHALVRVHPWNGLLYSSRFDDVHVVHAYGPADDGCRHVRRGHRARLAGT